MRLALLTLLFMLAVGQPAAADTASDLDRYMTARAALGQFSGTVMVVKGDAVLLEKGYGYADVGARIPATAATRYPVASLTKAVTALAILRLRDAGKLSLDDSVCRFVNPCPDAWKPVTLAMLVHHTSGVPDYEARLELGSAAYLAFMSAPDSAARIIADARGRPLDFPAGSDFAYSNTGYILLAAVISRASGRPYADNIRDAVLRPAGMARAGLGGAKDLALPIADGPGHSSADIAAGLSLETMMRADIPALDLAGDHGDAALFATARDLQAMLMTIRTTAGDEAFRPEGPGRYGFGWQIGQGFGQPQVSHNGILPGYVSRVAWYPDSGVTVIVLSNLDFARFTAIERDLTAITLGQPWDLPMRHRVSAIPAERLTGLVGDYRLASGTILTVSQGETGLTLSMTGRFTAGLLPEDDNRFYTPFFEGVATFERDAADKGVRLRVHYQGEDRIVAEAVAKG